MDTFSKAYCKPIDLQLQQEPLWHMNDAELTWSILSTEVNYTAPKIQSPFKTINNSPLFNLMEHSEHDSSDEIDLPDRYEEVTAHLKVSHSFDEVNDVSTTYLGGYLAPAGRRKNFSS